MAIVIVVVVWLAKAGYFTELGDKISEILPSSSSGTATSTATTNTAATSTSSAATSTSSAAKI